MTKLIEATEVKRDEAGFWYHPDIPEFEEGQEREYRAWLAEQLLETRFMFLEYEHPAYVRYFEEGDPDCSDWNPQPPDGEGWWLLAIGDTEDGPVATWARRPLARRI
jgi:hypothetical protein